MTIREAMEKGIAAITREPWNPYCRMELPVKHGGVWGRIVDPCGNLACGHPAERGIDVLLLGGNLAALNTDPDSDEWSEWLRPEDYSRFVEAQDAE